MIAENIQNIKENIKKTCVAFGRDADNVKLIVVSKTFPSEKILEAYESGMIDFGENYVQELIDKREVLKGKEIHWHFIGHLQSNKVKYIANWIHYIHSVDSESLAAEIHKRAEKAGRKIDVLIEVNTSEEATKFGVKPSKALDLLTVVKGFSNINIIGLMTIGPFTDNELESQMSFRLLKSIFDKANTMIFTNKPMTELSMGMTHDYKIAIREGSTMVRIGTAVFGSRTTKIH
jgi:pyridoxal phosphate enzyme (YggS family)